MIKTDSTIALIERKVVDALFTDLRDRRFLKWIFSERGEECLIDTFKDGEVLTGIDLEAQEEIKAAWSRIIATELTTLLERCEKAEAALQPFKTFEDDKNRGDDDLLSGHWADNVNETITFGHMRRARAARVEQE